MELLTAIERLPALEAFRLSFLVYPLVSALHIMGFAMLFACVFLMDLRIIGTIRVLDREVFLSLMRRFAVSGFAVAAVTGLPMFAVQAREYVFNPAFQAKMALLVLAGLNLWAFRKIADGDRTGRPYPRSARFLAFTSILVWVGVIVAGRFIGFI
ncbi:hypothetical protein GRZ55_02845 [Chelativorans sp. ZYF759]|uniref:DUF6644 family protein n=1 Tax=Chelativorans sp. ZYF759 TaxID=2692213 RepID=UPI00145DE47F|nr:DUF6644 family protein [Chelativorans sp. ZYF759]NMG38177.1 hypothetical protein [Chelativorans sp. ZYF759]